MFNYDGVKSATYTAPRQILANVEFQYSVGCIVAQSVGTNVTANGVTRKIAKAGTPITRLHMVTLVIMLFFYMM